MKKLVLSVLLIFGLIATNHGRPINYIYSLDDPFPAEEESYVDDIPFNTWEIAVNAIVGDDDLKLADEAYINDIPFDTKAIAIQYQLLNIKKYSDESNVNDIPFNTEKLMYEELASRLTDLYLDEANTSDLPDVTSVKTSVEHGDTYYIPTTRINVGIKHAEKQRKFDIKYFQPIIYPVKLDVPKIEIRNEPIDEQLIALPCSSL